MDRDRCNLVQLQSLPPPPECARVRACVRVSVRGLRHCAKVGTRSLVGQRKKKGTRTRVVEPKQFFTVTTRRTYVIPGVCLCLCVELS